MRKVLNISLPEKMVEKVKKEVESGSYASVSEFFRHLLRSREEENVLIELERSRGEIRTGKGKTLRSLKDLR